MGEPPSGKQKTNKIVDIDLLKEAIACSSSGITIADLTLPGQPLVFINKAFEKITGYSSEESMGKNCRFLQGDDREQPERTIIQQAIQKGEHCEVVFRNYRKDGSMFYNELYLAPITNSDGETTHFIGIQNDVTERMEFENERTQLMQRIIQSNEELEEFAHFISHDLRAPLRGIHSLATLLLEGQNTAKSSEDEEILNLMIYSVERMHNLIENLLEYARTGKTKDPIVDSPLADILDEIQSLLSPPDSITISYDRELPSLTGQRTLIAQVFQNLISNAIKYNDKEAGSIDICFEADDDHYHIAVKDNGPGIAPKYHKKIFGLFERLETDQNVESTGVGLALVKKITEQHGGRVSIESEFGQGSTFIVSWPTSIED